MTDKTHWRDLFDPSPWLYESDLKGHDVTVTICKVEAGELQKAGTTKKERKPVLHFEGKSKKLALGKTMTKTVAKLYGPYVQGWIGKKITLFCTVTDAFGEKDVPCIRIRPEVPK